MEEKLKKALKTSKQGTWIVLILSIILNVLIVINSKSVLRYFEDSWINLIYIIGLVIGLIMYKKEKYIEGAETIQWVALGNIIVQFVNFATYYILTKLVVFNIVSFMIGMIIPVILIIESLKVLSLSEDKKRSNKTTIIAIVVIMVICIAQVLLIYMPMRNLSNITSTFEEDETGLEENVINSEMDLSKRVLEEYDSYENEKYSYRYSNGAVRITEDIIKSTEWASKEAYINDLGIRVYIENSRLYYESKGKIKEIKSIKGNVKSVTETVGGGSAVIIALTEDGRVWNSFFVEEEQIDDFVQVDSLKPYTITRLATLHFKEFIDLVYYETNTGRLIDLCGFTIDEMQDKLLMNYGIEVCLEIGANGKLGYFDGEEIATNYKAITTSTGESIKAKKIYSYVKGDGIIRYMVVTPEDKLYEIQFGSAGNDVKMEITELSENNTVSSVICYIENNHCTAEFNMSDNKTIVKDIGEFENNYCDYYNAETNKIVELK